MTGHGVDVAWGAATHAGRRREINEDGHLAGDGVFLVADGMGGHEAGEVASVYALAALEPLRTAEHVDPDLVVALIDVAQRRVRGIDVGPHGRGAGTTVTGAVVTHQDDEPYWLFVNVGDSRTYLLAEGRLDQMSVDHSEVQELVDAGLLSANQARTHPRRNVVTRALGADVVPVPDFRYVPLTSGDRVLVCSDGLTLELTDDRIGDVLRTVGDPQRAAEQLVAQAVTAGGRDNVTVVVADVVATGRGTPPPRKMSEADLDEDTVPAGPGRAVPPAPRVGTAGEDER